MTGAIEAAVAEALETVCDPCSLAANAPLSIIDMGLVRSFSADAEGNVVVHMCVTSPCCTMAPNIVKGATEAISAAEGVASVRIEVDASLAWRPDWMTERGKTMLEKRRALTARAVRPQQWRTAQAAAERQPAA